MSLSEIQKERNEQCRERHELAVNRIRSMVTEETVEKAYVGYFQDVALFLLELENTRWKVASGEWENYTLEQMRSLNEILYSDILDKIMNGVMQIRICSEQFWNRNGTTAQFTLCRIAGRHPLCV